MPHRLICLVAVLLLLSACSSGKPCQLNPSDGDNSTIQATLHDALTAEFARLGIDPDKVPAAAPSGAGNAVFDLAAVVIDPDGPPDGMGGGEDPPTGISLAWTEQLIGDYDMNGEVNISDLSPLGNYFGELVEYDDPTLHGGFEYWPTGDPDAAGALNWRKARIDGDMNGELNISEISPLAAHWKEELSGYLVYVLPPGEASFTLAATLPHPDPADQLAPVRYGFTYGAVGQASSLPPVDPPRTVGRASSLPLTDRRQDACATDSFGGRPSLAAINYQDNKTAGRDARPPGKETTQLDPGIYALYVVPVDSLDAEGPASGIIYVDIDTHEVNISPVAALIIDPGFAGAPAEITLDASASYDTDGSIVAYEWDFDADSTVDWLSTDAIPETSSNGTVTDITPGDPGQVTVTYTQGYADWFYPSVACIDDKDAKSPKATARLGLSGWTGTILNESLDNYLISVHPKIIEADPKTGRKVLVAAYTIPEIHGEYRAGLFYLTETAAGTWEMEEATLPFLTGAEWEQYHLRDMFWDENLEPIILMNTITPKASWHARRSPQGSWEVKELIPPDPEQHVSNTGFSISCASPPGNAVLYFSVKLSDQADLFGDNFHHKHYVLFYDHGEWRYEYTGHDTAEDNSQLNRILGCNPDNIWAYFRVIGDYTGGPWGAHWEEGEGFVDPVRIDNSTLFFPSPHTNCIAALLGADGSQVTLWKHTPPLSLEYQHWLLVNAGDEFTTYDLDELAGDNEDSLVYASNYIYESNGQLSFFAGIVNGEIDRVEHWRLEQGGWLVEETTTGLPYPSEFTPYDLAQKANGEPVILYSASGKNVFPDFQTIHLISERLNPRVAE